MSRQYKYTTKDAKAFNKHGIDLVVYGQNIPEANVVFVSVKKGHFQEFYDKASSYTYYIVEGKGTFFLNDERIEVAATDLLAIPAKTRIHYFGTMKMVLTVAPAFNEKNEVHVRFVDEDESPYEEKST